MGKQKNNITGVLDIISNINSLFEDKSVCSRYSFSANYDIYKAGFALLYSVTNYTKNGVKTLLVFNDKEHMYNTINQMNSFIKAIFKIDEITQRLFQDPILLYNDYSLTCCFNDVELTVSQILCMDHIGVSCRRANSIIVFDSEKVKNNINSIYGLIEPGKLDKGKFIIF